MGVTIGTQLGSVEILALLGRGGMGEVYRARDLKLKREVAIKILPDEFSRDPDRVARFQREAELLASLNHPNIGAIYHLEEANGSRFLVLELVEGDTLAERIRRGAIPIDEALNIAKSICEALEAAHEKGITHRDLKPANVKITPEGKVKVLDFGLAKAMEPSPAGRGQGEGFSNSPTLSMAATQGGVILGTAAYMSPEQAKGLSADARSDVFAFGCVLYEMLMGRQVFQGESIAEILGAVLVAQPNLGMLPPALNPKIGDLIRRCLDKNPKRRWQAVGDLHMELELIAAEPRTPAIKEQLVGKAPLWRRGIPVVITAALVAMVAMLLPVWNSQPPAPVARFFVAPPDKTNFATGTRPAASAAISPDGRRLAFTARDTAGKLLLWIRSIDALTAAPVAGTDDASFPFWSPDRRFVAYFAQGKLMKVDTSGGPPQTLCDAPQARGGTWNRDGVIVFGNNGGVLQRVSSAGGQPAGFTKLAAGQAGHRFPSFLPDGRHIFFHANSIGATPENTGVYVATLDGESKRLVGADSSGIYASGYLLFGRDGTLMAQSFNAKTLELGNEPFPVAEHGESAVFGGFVAFSASDNGVLVYGIGTASNFGNLQLVWVDRSGKTIETVGMPGNYRGIDISPDAKRVAAHRHDVNGAPGAGDVWLLEWSRGTNLRFTFDASQENSSPVWSPDGARIVFASLRSAKWGLYEKASNGAGNEELLVESNLQSVPMSWSPDGQSIVYGVNDPKTKFDLWVLPLSGNRKPAPLLHAAYNEGYGQFSPDGKWLAYESDETGSGEVYVIPFPPGAGKWQVSTSGGSYPRWRRDSRELFYMDRREMGKVLAVEIKSAGATLEPGTPKELFDSGYLNLQHPGIYLPYVVSPDGQRFLIPRPASNAIENAASSPIAVVLNWTAAIKK